MRWWRPASRRAATAALSSAAQEDATLPARSLWPLVAEAVKIPVIAAGGIMTGVDIREALALGAKAVQMGTAFLATDESGIHPAYKQKLLSGGDIKTRLTRSFSGPLRPRHRKSFHEANGRVWRRKFQRILSKMH